MILMNKHFDVVGLGSCAADITIKVKKLAATDNKVNCNPPAIVGGGVTANNLAQTARLGLPTAWCGVLGKDDYATALLKEFEQEKVTPIYKQIEHVPTQFSWIPFDEHGERHIYTFPNVATHLTPAIVKQHFSNIIQQSVHFHTEVATIPLAAAICGATIAKAAGSRVFLDIDNDPLHLLKESALGTEEEFQTLISLANVIKVSEFAAKDMAKENDLNKVIQYLLQFADIVAITLGKKGCIVADKKQTVHCPAYSVQCVNTTGAGDSFMGGACHTPS